MNYETLTQDVKDLRNKAKAIVLMDLVNSCLTVILSRELQNTKLTKDIADSEKNVERAVYELSQIVDEEDPDYAEKKEQAEKKIARRKETHKTVIKECAEMTQDNEKEIELRNQKIVDVENGKVKVYKEKIEEITHQLIWK